MPPKLFLNKIIEKIGHFEPISLLEMEGVKLMDRVDVKYMIPIPVLAEILTEALPHYRLLEINNERLCSYETLYYDTPSLQLYHQHQARKLNRYKVRSRYYVASNLRYFEVKFKNNKGRTIKKRIKTESIHEQYLEKNSAEFLKELTTIEPDSLKGHIWVNYSRLTFVSKTSSERLTIDLNLTFKNKTSQANFGQIAIAEIKQEKFQNSAFSQILKKHNLKPGFISKYCLGIISLFDVVKQNNFKKQLKFITKIIHQYDTFSAAYSA